MKCMTQLNAGEPLHLNVRECLSVEQGYSVGCIDAHRVPDWGIFVKRGGG